MRFEIDKKYIRLKVHHDPIDPVLVQTDVCEPPEGDGQPRAPERATEGDDAVDLVGVPAPEDAPRDGGRTGVPRTGPTADGDGAHFAGNVPF